MKETEVDDGWPEEHLPIATEQEPEHFLALWAEWDFGQEGMLFESEERGREWLRQAMIAQYDSEELMLDHLDISKFSDVFDEGLAGFTLATLIRD